MKPSVNRYVDGPTTRELNATLAAPDAQIAETNARLGIKPKATPAASMSPSPLATIQPTPPPTPQLTSSTIVAATNAPASGPVTRSRPLPTPSEPSRTQHTFAPYIKVRSLVDIDTDIRDLLLAGLDPKDTGRSGWVYGFRFPAAHTITALPKPHSAHDSPDAVARRPAAYIKIGYTGKLLQRMDSIEEQCGYVPELQFSVPTRHYLLVEGLVHLELDGTRRRETVPCPKCQVRHIEWFEVDAAVARRKVEAWRDWVGREPFEGRVLKKEWAARVRMVRIGQEGQWEWFVKDSEVPRT
jgi:T5orf172 domain-containing protein